MKSVTPLILALLLGVKTMMGALPAGWNANLSTALAAAITNQQPLLVYFTASWCSPCRLMASTTLTNESVQRTLQAIEHVALDLDEHPAEARQYNVQAVPTFILVTPTGDEAVRETGFHDPQSFIRFLTNGVTQVSEFIARQKNLQEALATANKLAQAPDAAAAHQAAAEYFKLCAQPEGSIRQAAVAALNELAAKNPAMLFDGLNHPRLAARIEVANLLRARLGETFTIDPWSDEASRKIEITTWQEKLTIKH